MATYVNDLRLKEIATGDESGTWGTSTNTNLELIGEAFSFGTEAITTNADTHTTTIADGSTDPGRSMYLKYTGTLDSACTITIGPNTVSKMWFIENGTSGSQNIIISQGSGANITIPPGDTKAIYSDGAGSGAAMVDAFASLSVVDLKVQDDLTVTDDMTVGGTLGVTGVFTGTSLDISGDIDVDGTTNLDVVDIDGAVDMASTLGVTGVVTANAGVVVDNITIDGTQIDLSSGDLTLDVAGKILLSADDAGTIQLFDGTLHYGSILEDNSNLIIQSIVQDEDILFKGDDGGSVITALTLDMSAAGAATFNSTVTSTAFGSQLATTSFLQNVLTTSVASSSGAFIRMAVSNAGNPTYSFEDDTNTGVFTSGADTLNFTTGGTERVRVHSSGQVSIGTTTAEGGLLCLDTSGNNNRSIVIGRSATDDASKSSALSILHYNNGSEEPVCLVGAGIDDDTNNSVRIGGGFSNLNSATILDFYTAANNDTTTGSIRARIDSSGNFGIGTTVTDPYSLGSTGKTLSVNSSNASTGALISLETADANRGYLFANASNMVLSAVHTDIPLKFNTNDTTRMTIDGGGRVMIGETSNSGYSNNADDLIVGNNGASTETGISLGSTSASGIRWNDGADAGLIEYVHSDNRMSFYTAGSEKVRIDTSGNVGINTAAPNAPLTIQTASATGSQAALRLNNPVGFGSANTGCEIIFSQDRSSSENFKMAAIVSGQGNASSSNEGDLKFFTTTGGSIGERVRIDSGGNLGILETAPTSNLHIGASGADAHREIRIDGTNGSSQTYGFIIEADGENGRAVFKVGQGGGTPAQELMIHPDGGICFNTDTAAANALDDYEEGTWTGSPSASSSSSLTVTDEKYTKIGNQVTIQCTINFSGCSGNLNIAGLPFATSPAAVGVGREDATSGYCIYGRVISGSSTINMFFAGAVSKRQSVPSFGWKYEIFNDLPYLEHLQGLITKIF